MWFIKTPSFFFLLAFHFSLSPPHPVIMLVEGNYSSPNYSKVARGTSSWWNWDYFLASLPCIVFSIKKFQCQSSVRKFTCIFCEIDIKWFSVCIFRHITLSHYCVLWLHSFKTCQSNICNGEIEKVLLYASFNILMRNN